MILKIPLKILFSYNLTPERNKYAAVSLRLLSNFLFQKGAKIQQQYTYCLPFKRPI
jgi:hypothetical protein